MTAAKTIQKGIIWLPSILLSGFMTHGCPLPSWLPILQTVFQMNNSLYISSISNDKRVFGWAKAQFKARLYFKSSSRETESSAGALEVFCVNDETELLRILKLVDAHNMGIKYPVIIFGHISATSNSTLLETVRIDQQVFYIDEKSGVLLETYSINNQVITNMLGQFDIHNISFGPTEAWKTGFLSRRSNFHGFHISAMTDTDAGRMDLKEDYKSTSPFIESNQTYVVTQAAHGQCISSSWPSN